MAIPMAIPTGTPMDKQMGTKVIIVTDSMCMTCFCREQSDYNGFDVRCALLHGLCTESNY